MLKDEITAMPERVHFNFNFSDLGISTDQIGRLINYDKGDDREIITSQIDEMLSAASEICDLMAEFSVWEKIEIGRRTGRITIGNVVFNTGRIIPGQLRNSESIAVFICTAGKSIVDLSRKLISEKDFLAGYILDVIGSEAVDSVADLMQEELKKLALGSGMKITNRYSPGYCGWHVSEQQLLFSLIPDNFCGVKLNSSSLMDPVKSVSGIIGMGKNVHFNQYTCNLCDQENCIYRDFKKSTV